MKNIEIRNIKTQRLSLKIPTLTEQQELWNILRQADVNKYYFPTPNRIFNKYNLYKNRLEDLIKAREIFQEELNDWERQQPFYEQKIIGINNGENNQKYTWSVFLHDGTVIGQMTVQPNSDYPDNPSIRDVGWFINPKYQGQGFGYEMAQAILTFMFNEVEIDEIRTSSATVNLGSWKLMEKLGFERFGIKESTYLDENNQKVKCYCYKLTKETFIL